MNKDVVHHRLSNQLALKRYLDVFSTFSEVEAVICELRNHKPPLSYFSVLGKATGFSIQDVNSHISGFTKLTSSEIHLLQVAELGSVFVCGALSSLLLEKIDGKALGSLEGGLSGILNGYGINQRHTNYYLKHLKEGKILVIAWGYAQSGKYLVHGCP